MGDLLILWEGWYLQPTAGLLGDSRDSSPLHGTAPDEINARLEVKSA